MRRRRRRAPVWAAALVVTCGAVLASPPGLAWPGALWLGSFLRAPQAAVEAARQTLDETMDKAGPGNGAIEAQAPGGFWTEPPARQPASEEQTEEGPEEEETQATQGDAPQEPEPEAEATPEPEPMPEGMAPLIETFFPQGHGAGYIQSGAGTVRNCTALSDAEVAAEMMQALPFSIEVGSSAPQVLIMHTHATETYELAERSWCDPAFSARSTDLSVNMAAVGDEIAAQLNAAGIMTLHDTTLHDYPSYTGSYAKSNATVSAYLAQYSSIKVVLDVHRDAIQYDDGTRVKPVVTIDGQKAAQVMIICGADRGGNLPNFRQNLRFASRWQDKMEGMYPGLTRPVLFDYRYYNQDLTTGSLLIEMGGHANTLEEAKYSGRLVGKALAALFRES